MLVAVKVDYRKSGAWLAGSGVTFAALYLIGTAASLGSKHPAPVFPYWIFLGLFVLGAGAYLLTLAKGRASRIDAIAKTADAATAETGPRAISGHDREPDAGEAVDWWADQMAEIAEPEPAPARPAINDRWRLTHSLTDAPGMAQLGLQHFSQPAYMRTPEKTPPWVRVRVVVACDPLGEQPGWQELRGRFLGLLAQESIRGQIYELTEIPKTATWRHRGTQRRSWLEADLTVEDEAQVPAASAQLFLPEDGLPLAGLQQGCAQLTLHVDHLPDTARMINTATAREEDVPVIQGLPYWRRRIEASLALPGALDGWLRHQLGLETSGLAQFGIMLQAGQSIKEMVDPGGIRALSSPYTLSQFTGWAVADAEGKTTGEMATQMMLDLSERVLHLDGSVEEMSGL